MKQRIYIDANSGIGRTNFREDKIPYKTEVLLEEQKYCRIHKSLVYSQTARDYGFTKGNSELIEEISKSSRLVGVATVIPHIKYEIDKGYGYYDELLEQGIKAFKMYPKSFNHNFDPFTMQEIAEYMINKRIPLFVDLSETDFNCLRETIDAFKELKVVICNTYWSQNRLLFPLMDKYDNLHFDISSNQANDILKICTKHFGIDRVLFGSDYPNKSLGAIKSLIEYSELCEEDKDKVAYKNAAGLIGMNTSNIELYREEECMLDEIALTVDNGKPLDDVLVIDSHTHMVDKEHYTVSSLMMLNGDEDSIVKKMDLLGIDSIITSPWEGIMTSGMSANKTTLNAHSKYRDRIYGYATCNPNYEEDLSEVIELYHEKHKFIGIKPYWPKHKYDLLGKKYEKWFEYGNENRLIMLVHSGNQDIANKVEQLSEKYKDMTFILAHTGISYDVARWNIDVAKKRDNVYLEITYTSLTNGVIEYLVQEVGADKVLFGSDLPMRDPAPQLAWVTYAKISIEDKKKILGENIKKLIDRCYKK